MRLDQLSPEMVELAKLHGIDLDRIPVDGSGELADEDLEAIVGGKVFPGPGLGWGPGWGYGGGRYYGGGYGGGYRGGRRR